MLIILATVVALLVFPGLYELATSKSARFLWSKTRKHGASSDPPRLFLLSIVIFYDKLFMHIEDRLLPAIGRTSIQKPVFILGHMRSGTTNLHRSILRSRTDATSLNFIDVIANSFTLRLPLLAMVHAYMVLTGAYERKDHRIRMHEPEEEDMSLIHRYKGLLLLEIFSSTFLVQREVYNDLYDAYDEDDVDHLKRLMRRRLWASGRTEWIGKPITFVSDIGLLKKAFPDALFVVSIRNPCDAISSTMQMHRDKLNVENELERSLSIYRGVCELLSSRDDRVIPIRFEDYVEDRSYWISRVLQRLDGTPAPGAKGALQLEPRETHRKTAVYVQIARERIQDQAQLWAPVFEQLGYKFPGGD